MAGLESYQSVTGHLALATSNCQGADELRMPNIGSWIVVYCETQVASDEHAPILTAVQFAEVTATN